MPRREQKRGLYGKLDDAPSFSFLFGPTNGIAGHGFDRGQASEGRANPRQRRRGVEIPHDDEHQVVGHVVGFKEFAAHLRRHSLNVFRPADDRPTVGVRPPGKRGQRLEPQATGVVLHPHPALLENHLALGSKALLGDDQVGEAFRLEVDHQGERFRGHVLEIHRHIAARKRVDPAPARFDEPGMHLGFDVLRALEHHVLEEVREAGVAALVLGTHTDPDLERDHRSRVVLEREDAQPIGQHRLHDIAGGILERGFGRDGSGKRDPCREQETAYRKAPMKRGTRAHDALPYPSGSGPAARPSPETAR